jgi:hypothetical protein
MIGAVRNNGHNGRRENIRAHERRGSTRYAFAGAASVVDAESNARVIARASDISMGGCYIDAIACFPKGSAVWLRVTRGQQSFTTKAIVVWNRDGLGMSLAFMSTDPEQLWIVRRWIEETREGAPSSAPTSSPSSLPAAQAEPEKPSGLSKPDKIEKAADEEQEILKYLILMLVQKSVLSEAEGAALLQKLLK